MPKDNSKAARAQRATDAAARQAARDARSDAAQLDLLVQRPGDARKERNRLV